MHSLDSLISGVTSSPRRLAVALVSILILAYGGARVLRGGPTQTVEVLGPLNVRSGPGREHPVVTHAGKGARLRIAKPDERGWAAVRRGRRTIGYVRALPEYVRTEEGAGGSSPAWWLLAALAAGGAWVVVTRGRTASAPASIPTTPPADPALESDRTLTAPRPAPAPAPVYAAPPPARVHAAPAAQEETEAARNGREFEHWAALRLGKLPFCLKDWRGDKFVAGVFAESTLYPDLLVEYQGEGDPVQFAVECKWRSRYYGTDELRWGEQRHLRRYQQYAEEKGLPVYLLIGVGGTGAAPREVYLVPLQEVPSSRLYFRELKGKDRVDHDGVFRYDGERRRLRLLPVGS